MSHLAAGLVRDLTREVDVFGLHMLTLDVRQHATRHGRALDEIFNWAGVCPRYSKLTPNERFELLESELSQNRPLVPVDLPFTPETREVVQTFRTIAAILEGQCSEAIDTYITSGTSEPGNMLEVLLCARGTAVPPGRGHQPLADRAALGIARAVARRRAIRAAAVEPSPSTAGILNCAAISRK